MRFTILPVGNRPPSSARSEAFFITDNWDDYHYKTQFHLFLYDATGNPHRLGNVKVGQFDMDSEQYRPKLPNTFTKLPTKCFSLGQDDSYYEQLDKLGPDTRDEILKSLRDLAADEELFSRALNEAVTGISLLRFISVSSVRGQFRRLTRGGVRLSRYAFSYNIPTRAGKRLGAASISIEVEPESYPPTNIHVLIGRNGVGKSWMLDRMSHALVDPKHPDIDGSFTDDEAENYEPQGENENTGLFANLVSVSFSAFDVFDPMPVRQNKASGLQYSYVGLKYQTKTESGGRRPPKTPDQLSSEFVVSVRNCRQGARAGRWRRALEMLEGDPIFRDADVASIANGVSGDNSGTEDDFEKKAKSLFGRLSSGHKIVLLTITRLVETVEERSLVLLDEPEAHLHPPLLAAFTRSLSDLLTNRNGVAIMATHSPVILQEVPRTCVWKIRRSGLVTNVDRPEIETFGENVGILTREVFGLEVTKSGYHQLLQDAVDKNDDYATILGSFNDQLGSEARALIMAMLAAKRSSGSES